MEQRATASGSRRVGRGWIDLMFIVITLMVGLMVTPLGLLLARLEDRRDARRRRAAERRQLRIVRAEDCVPE